MKRCLAMLMACLMLAGPLLAHAGDLKLVSDKDLELVVMDVPKDLKERLGGNYILIDFEYFKQIEQQAARTNVLEAYNNQILNDLQIHQIHIEDLEAIIDSDRNHISALDQHIDRQRKIIADLAPTRWDKYKFGIGILLGVGITGVAAYSLDQIN